MSPLVNELGGTEDVGAPDVLSGLMEVDDSNGEEDALFDPMEIDNNKDENGRGRGRKRGRGQWKKVEIESLNGHDCGLDAAWLGRRWAACH